MGRRFWGRPAAVALVERSRSLDRSASRGRLSHPGTMTPPGWKASNGALGAPRRRGCTADGRR
jgi:hypothetical protein